MFWLSILLFVIALAGFALTIVRYVQNTRWANSDHMGASIAFNRSNSSSTIMTTTSGPRLAIVTGSARARSISRPKPYLAFFAVAEDDLDGLLADPLDGLDRGGAGCCKPPDARARGHVV